MRRGDETGSYMGLWGWELVSRDSLLEAGCCARPWMMMKHDGNEILWSEVAGFASKGVRMNEMYAFSVRLIDE